MTGVTLEPVPTIVLCCPTYTKYWVLTFVFSSASLVRWFGVLVFLTRMAVTVLYIFCSVYVSTDVIVFTFQLCACRFNFWRREGFLFYF